MGRAIGLAYHTFMRVALCEYKYSRPATSNRLELEANGHRSDEACRKLWRSQRVTVSACG